MPLMPTDYGAEYFVPPSEQGSDRYYQKQDCPYCGRPFATRSGMMAHIENKHSEKGNP